MSERRGAIPNLIIFILFLIIGLWFAVPSEVDIGIMILEAFAKAIQPLNVERANQMIGMYIVFFRVFGVLLIVASAVGIYFQLRRREYF